MDFEKVGPELNTAFNCMQQLSWLTLIILVLAVLLLATLLIENNQIFWILLVVVLLVYLAGTKR
jgi:hypothetical protein